MRNLEINNKSLPLRAWAQRTITMQSAAATYPKLGQLLGYEDDTDTYYIVPGAHGSTKVIFNDAGNVVNRIDYDCLGKIRNQTTTPQLELLWRGKYFDSDVGLYVLSDGSIYNPITGYSPSSRPIPPQGPPDPITWVTGGYPWTPMPDRGRLYASCFVWILIGGTLILMACVGIAIYNFYWDAKCFWWRDELNDLIESGSVDDDDIRRKQELRDKIRDHCGAGDA